jgi:AraC family transcriptional regulator, regulatory protein of adaptative response / methylated-DNA-[protein]-cysteine methyltransferase
VSKYIRITSLPISEQIARDIDKQVFKDLKQFLPPIEYVQMELSLHNCVFGPVLIGSHNDHLLAVELGSDADECYRNFINKWGKSNPRVVTRVNTKISDQVLDCIDSGNIDPNLHIDLYGTGTYFQRSVWKAIQEIQPGYTMSYQDIADKINRKNSARSIGSACGANPIAIIVPCHRVVKSNGDEGNYAWGTDIKHKLLDRERI